MPGVTPWGSTTQGEWPGQLPPSHEGVSRNRRPLPRAHRPPRPRRAGHRVRHRPAQQTITLPDGREHHLDLYARAGTIGIGTLDADGELQFTPLPRIRTHRNADKTKYRWYNDHRLPGHLGSGTISVRLHGNPSDAARRFNRTENVRPIPQDDPAFQELFRRRNDAESINRGLDDSLWLRRAHSVGQRRQLLNLLGYAVMVNSLAIARGRPAVPIAA